MAGFVLALHLLVIGFNVFGLIAIPLGAWAGWAFIRVRWWRVLHLFSLGLVALQALLGRACFLTTWQDELAGAPGETPLIMRWVNSVIYWPLPIEVFTIAYVLVVAYALALYRWAPPVRRLATGTGSAPVQS